MCLGGSHSSRKLTVGKQRLCSRDARNLAWGFPPRRPKSGKLRQARLPLPPKAFQEADTWARRRGSELGGPSHLRRPSGASSAVGPGWQCCCRLMDRFPMRVLCRLPAVPVQGPDQHGCTAPHPSHECRNRETSHPQRTAINLCRRQAADRTGGRQQADVLCRPSPQGRPGPQTGRLPASGAPIASARSPQGRQTRGTLLYCAGH